MRIQRLLFLLSLTLLGGATPPHPGPIGWARCLSLPAPQRTAGTANATTPIVLREDFPKYDPAERDYLIKTLAFEAPNETEEGKAAVVHVILNRMRSDRWGDNVKDVVMQPWQFEPWVTRRREIERLSPDDLGYRDAARIADAVLAGQMPDPTDGATHFLNPKVVRKRRGGSLPSWARGEGQPIGRHIFYSPYEGSAVPQQASLSLGDNGPVFMLTPKACR